MKSLIKKIEKLEKKVVAHEAERMTRPPYALIEERSPIDGRPKVHMFHRHDNMHGDIQQISIQVMNTLEVAKRLESYDWYMDAKELFEMQVREEKKIEKKRIKLYVKTRKKFESRS